MLPQSKITETTSSGPILFPENANKSVIRNPNPTSNVNVNLFLFNFANSKLFK